MKKYWSSCLPGGCSRRRDPPSWWPCPRWWAAARGRWRTRTWQTPRQTALERVWNTTNIRLLQGSGSVCVFYRSRGSIFSLISEYGYRFRSGSSFWRFKMFLSTGTWMRIRIRIRTHRAIEYLQIQYGYGFETMDSWSTVHDIRYAIPILNKQNIYQTHSAS